MKILIKLTPLEPFFFGNEKSFAYGETRRQKAGSYYSVSDDLPSQTTLFGVLRYLGIEEKKADYSLNENDISNIGNESFDLTKEGQSFGRIIGISPLYLTDQNNQFYIKTPLNHKKFDPGSGRTLAACLTHDSEEYTPFSEYREVQTSAGMKLLPEDYDAKVRIANSFVRLSDGKVVTDVFSSVEKVGINTAKKENAYFKKKYKLLNGYSFSFFAEVEEGFPEIPDQVVFLGQGKSAFEAKVFSDIEEPDFSIILERLKNHPCPVALALSDIYIKQDILQLYELCNFAMISNKGYRVFSTNYERGVAQIKRFNKSAHYINLIENGSVFLISDMDKFQVAIDNGHAKKAGFNYLLMGGN
jgi:CRISPR-associated protein Cmr3